MKIETVFKNGLISLLKTKDLDDINVVMLCDYVKKNRQTFYYHFRDISEVVNAVLLQSKVGYGKKLMDYEAILKEMESFIIDNYSFTYNVNNSYSADKLYSFIYSFFYVKISAILKDKIDRSTEISRYVATLSSKELLFWISTKKAEKVISLNNRLIAIYNYFTKQYSIDIKMKKRD